jgi:hypothetical protein
LFYNPQEFCEHGVVVETQKEVAVGLGRGYGGGPVAQKDLGIHLSRRYYEIFKRGKLNDEKQIVSQNGSIGEPEKKKPRGGRPKLIDGVDTHKLNPLLSQGCNSQCSAKL